MSNYPNTFYRVSLKAVIRDSDDKVLVVKEKGSSWSLPGGGLDHGEDVHTGLARELHEEILFKGDFTQKLTGVETFFVESKQAWLMWLVFEVDIKDHNFAVGPMPMR